MKKIMRSQTWKSYSSITAGLCFFASASFVEAATDPGVRPGPADAGAPLAGLTADELNAFTIAQEVFTAVDSVNGTIPGEDDEGLGPTFNLNSCAGCHAFPEVGGGSPRTNPQLAVANLDHRAGAPIANRIPSFLTANGPIREVRFKRNADGTPDGGVTIDDLLYYLAIFSEGLLQADVDDGSGTGTLDGGVTIDDLLYYLTRFADGC